MTRSAPGRVLVVTEWWPRAEESAGSRRFTELLRILARDRAVDLWVERAEAQAPVREAPLERRSPRPALAALGIETLDSGWRGLADPMRSRRYAIVFFEFFSVARRYQKLVRRRQPAAKVIVDSVDVHFARLGTAQDLGLARARGVARTRRREVATYRAADAVVVCSESDRRVLDAIGDVPPCFVVPIVHSLRARPSCSRGPEMLFVGHFGHAPNRDGIEWFCREVWPSLRRREPRARLRIAGSGSIEAVGALRTIDGIEVLGWVENLGALLDEVAVSVAPIRFGAGMSGKVCEAMASAVPVVATSVAAAGLDARAGIDLMVADTAAEFSSRLTELLADDATADRIGRAGQAFVGRLCDPEHVARQVATMLDAVLGHGPVDTAVAPRSRSGIDLFIFAAQHATLHALRTLRQRIAGWRP